MNIFKAIGKWMMKYKFTIYPSYSEKAYFVIKKSWYSEEGHLYVKKNKIDGADDNYRWRFGNYIPDEYHKAYFPDHDTAEIAIREVEAWVAKKEAEYRVELNAEKEWYKTHKKKVVKL